MAALYSAGNDGPAPIRTRTPSSSSRRIEARAPVISRSTITVTTCRMSDSEAFWTIRSRMLVCVMSRPLVFGSNP
jgi:hypothetical protein